MTAPKNQPLTMEDPEHGTLLSMPAVLLLAAGAAYDQSGEVTLSGRTKGQIIVRRVLSAAAKGGFTKGQLLETLLSRLEVSTRVKVLATEAVEAAGTDTVLEILNVSMQEMP